MSPSLITIWRTAGNSPEDRDLKAQSRVSIPFDELKYWLATQKIFRHIFRYRSAVLRVYDLELMGKPFATSVLMWLLAWGDSRVRDDQGRELRIGLGKVCALGFKRFLDTLKIPALLQKAESERALLSDENNKKDKLDLSLRPVYLRTDLTFGLQSGGSVGHIGGVLNHLEEFASSPLFLTTDKIPMVRESIETHRITPGKDFWDFKEELPLAFNRTFFEGASAILTRSRISFIYQRYSLNNYSGVRFAFQCQVPLILEFNGSEIWVGRQWEKGLKHEKLSEEIELLNLRSAELVVVVSRSLKENLLRQGILEEKILVNPNGVDIEKYSPEVDGSTVRQKYGLGEKTVLGFIGTFGKWHGAEVLAQAFGELIREFPELREQTRLLMIGDGVTMPLVKEILAKYGVLELCVLTGTLPQAEGPAYLAACDILVASHVPNLDGTPFFGSPTKLFEYMAMGKGIVASDLDQIGEILKHNETAWMVKPGDKDSLKEGLKVLIEDQTLRERLGRAAREECVSRYTWKEHTRKIIEKLKERCG